MNASTVVLQWHFTPPDYFEQSITVSREDYTLVIDNGKVEATVLAEVYDAAPSMHDELHGALTARFLGAQLLSHSSFELSRPSMTRVRPDGGSDISVELEGEVIRTSLGVLDTQFQDQHGNIVSDSRRDRIEQRQSLAELISAHSGDLLLTALLASHRTSVRDPDNELVHLYEIRDALGAKFGGEMKTRNALGIAGSQWSRLGQLCSDEPLRQGRHRGKKWTVLRDATHGELEEARAIAHSMIEKYVQWLRSTEA
jgi:hypothetical protein